MGKSPAANYYEETNFLVIWLPILGVLVVTLFLLVLVTLCYRCVNKRERTFVYANATENVALNNHNVNNSPTGKSFTIREELL